MEETFREQDVLRRVRRELYLTEGLSAMDDESLRTLIRKILLRQNPEHDFSAEELSRFVDTLYGNFRGLGILEEYLNDDTVSEIMINAWDVLFVERNGVVERSPRTFSSEKELEDIIQRIVAGAGREVNRANPIVDTRLPGGERVNVVLPPASIETPVVTIRRFPKDRITMRTLVEYGTLSEEAAEFLERLVKAKYNIFISGGTSSGKTTFLNALSDYIPKRERIITIEDSAELQLTGIDNLVRLEIPQFQYCRQRRDHHPGPHPDVSAHAAGTHHRRRSPGRRGTRHARCHEYRPRRLALHRSRQLL